MKQLRDTVDTVYTHLECINGTAFRCLIALYLHIYLQDICFVLCNAQFDEVVNAYIHGENTYKKIRDLMNSEMDQGLSRSGNADAAVKMFITYVQSLPNGSGNAV